MDKLEHLRKKINATDQKILEAEVHVAVTKYM